MFDSFFLAADVSSTISRIVGNFGIDSKLLIAQILNFAIVSYLLYRFGFKPVVQNLDQRQARIAEGLQYANEMEAKLKEADELYRQKTDEANKDAAQILESARQRAKVFEASQTQEAIAKSESIIKRAQDSIVVERKQMMESVRKDLASLVVATTSKVLGHDLTQDDRKRFSDSATKQLGLN